LFPILEEDGKEGDMTSQKIAVVGDIHDQWEADDEIALRHLGVDLVLFVGDFGNESLDIVEAVAEVSIPKAAILGNHDAWWTATEWGRQKCPYDRTQEDRVQEQLDLLGFAHIGYGKLDISELQLTVVGSRPFSWGGSTWKNTEFYEERYGVKSFAESTARIVAAANSAAYETIIFMGHNGPTGLGELPEDPCGKDWHPIGGDYGDPDFAEALAQTRAAGKTISLVTFGHMHHNLRHTKQVLRTSIAESNGTVYLNAARVPRIVEKDGDRLRNFSIVSLDAGVVSQVSQIWVSQDLSIASEEIIYRRELIVQSSSHN